MWKHLGYVGVDSGQLMIVDPCYLDDWVDEEYIDNRAVESVETGKVYVFSKDFKDYEVELEGKTVNQHISDGSFYNTPDDTPLTFSYNGVSHGTCGESPYVSIPYALGHEGRAVSFRSGYGDGTYSIEGRIENGRVLEIRIKMD